jgi:hypothetical protein
MASTKPFVQPATASALRSHLIGAWSLQSYMSVAEPPSTARPLYPMTKNTQGMIMYTPDGYMSAQISIPGQQKFESGTASESDWAECGKRYFAYSGPFFVTEEDGKVKLRHNMRIGNRPAMVGDVQLRAWRFEEVGKLLILSSEEAKEVKVRRCLADNCNRY